MHRRARVAVGAGGIDVDTAVSSIHDVIFEELPVPSTSPAAERHDHRALEGRAAVLAASCAVALRDVAGRGGPPVDVHLDELRRLLVRREGRRSGIARRRQIRHAVEAVRAGRPGAIHGPDRHALVRDLEVLRHALEPRRRSS
jgi:hypothetical protein